MDPYSCNFSGICEEDTYGIYANKALCEIACSSRPQKEINYEIYKYAPEEALSLAPSDQRKVLARYFRHVDLIDNTYVVRKLLEAVAFRDYGELLQVYHNVPSEVYQSILQYLQEELGDNLPYLRLAVLLSPFPMDLNVFRERLDFVLRQYYSPLINLMQLRVDLMYYRLFLQRIISRYVYNNVDYLLWDHRRREIVDELSHILSPHQE